MKIYISGKITGDSRYKAKFRKVTPAREWVDDIVAFCAEDVDALMADIVLACMALHHVAEFATDKCRFVPLPGKNGG